MTEKTKKFLQKLKNFGCWNDGYDYSKFVYRKNNTEKGIVIDKRFGTEHLISPKSLLKGTKCTSVNVIGGYLSCHEARNVVKSFGFKNEGEWREYSKNERPPNIPSHPNIIYKNKGWIDMGDWIGSNVVATQKRKYRSFERAREFVHKLELESQSEWIEYCKSGNKPNDIPNAPSWTYKNKGWISVGDWLGTGRVSDNFKEYLKIEDAKKIIYPFNLKNRNEYEIWWDNNKPNNIPKQPHNTYKNKGWISMYDWIGTKPGWNGEYRPFEEAIEFARSLGLKGQKEWFDYCKSGKKPADIPYNPDREYKKDKHG